MKRVDAWGASENVIAAECPSMRPPGTIELHRGACIMAHGRERRTALGLIVALLAGAPIIGFVPVAAEDLSVAAMKDRLQKYSGHYAEPPDVREKLPDGREIVDVSMWGTVEGARRREIITKQSRWSEPLIYGATVYLKRIWSSTITGTTGSGAVSPSSR